MWGELFVCCLLARLLHERLQLSVRRRVRLWGGLQVFRLCVLQSRGQVLRRAGRERLHVSLRRRVRLWGGLQVSRLCVLQSRGQVLRVPLTRR